MIHQPPPHYPCGPCSAVGLDMPGIRNVGPVGHCAVHLTRLLRTFRPEVWTDGGIGLPVDEDGLLECSRCQATWEGIALDPCPWCIRSLEIQREHQIDLVLTPPDVDPDDAGYEDRMLGWAERLKVAVDAELITTDQAAVAWRRARQGQAA